MHNFVRSMGFEPMISGMKTQRPRPLDEPRMENLYSTPARIQTLITGSVDRRSIQLNYQGKFVWASDGNRTHDLLLGKETF